MAVRKGRQPGSYVVEFQTRGQRVFERMPPGVTRAQAQERETQLRRQIFDGVLGRREITIAEGIGTWLLAGRRKNHRQAESEARQWEPWAGRLLREAPEVASDAVAMWTASTGARRASASRDALARTRSGIGTTPPAQENGWPAGSGGSKLRAIKSATINRRLALLKAVLKHSWKQGLIPENLSGRITLLREDNKREVYLTREEVTRIAKCAPTSASRSAVMVAAYTGLRAAELLALEPRHVISGRSLTISQSKTGKPRIVPVPSAARALLGALPLGLSYWQLHKEFGRAKRKAGLPHVKFHDLRHTCASWLINAGVDLYTVGKILGHSGPATTARYAHLSTATLEQAMRRLK